MNWLIGVAVLLGGAAALRRLLFKGEGPARRSAGLARLDSEREALYRSVARDLETQTTIMGVSLNDAFEERDSGRHEIAWHLVQIAASEWERVNEVLALALGAMGKAMPGASLTIPARGMAGHRFKSRLMTDFLRFYEFLDLLLFHSKARFQLRVHVLRRAAETLTREFRRSFRYAERTEDRPPELWTRLDLYCHDFDVVTKETLFALRTFLPSLSSPALKTFAADLQNVARHGARSISDR